MRIQEAGITVGLPPQAVWDRLAASGFRIWSGFSTFEITNAEGEPANGSLGLNSQVHCTLKRAGISARLVNEVIIFEPPRVVVTRLVGSNLKAKPTTAETRFDLAPSIEYAGATAIALQMKTDYHRLLSKAGAIMEAKLMPNLLDCLRETAEQHEFPIVSLSATSAQPTLILQPRAA